MCKGLTRSSGSIHLLLIPCRHQSLNADTHRELARTRKHSVCSIGRVMLMHIPGQCV
uniref:Uncharacterized protein n=1 Tax=Scophthalmus maximus TaxID=52904 RepID=A0A8D3BMA8_SCOMX